MRSNRRSGLSTAYRACAEGRAARPLELRPGLGFVRLIPANGHHGAIGWKLRDVIDARPPQGKPLCRQGRGTASPRPWMFHTKLSKSGSCYRYAPPGRGSMRAKSPVAVARKLPTFLWSPDRVGAQNSNSSLPADVLTSALATSRAIPAFPHASQVGIAQKSVWRFESTDRTIAHTFRSLRA
jgi:hypothetical protein